MLESQTMIGSHMKPSYMVLACAAGHEAWPRRGWGALPGTWAVNVSAVVVRVQCTSLLQHYQGMCVAGPHWPHVDDRDECVSTQLQCFHFCAAVACAWNTYVIIIRYINLWYSDGSL